MSTYKSILPCDFDPVFDRIGKEWMLITVAGKDADGKETVNTMTASWGGMGFLWRKPVAFIFIRPQRYTFTLTEQSERLSLSFLGEEYRDALNLCGTKSGRDCDKLAEANLSCAMQGGVPFIAQAHTALICRKLYADEIKEACFLDKSPLYTYQAGDFHKMYIVEIEDVLVANK